MTKNKWEITAGRFTSWQEHKNWWVMTWIINGSAKQSDFSPTPVSIIDGLLVVPYAPAHAVKFGNVEKTAGPAGDRIYYILPKNVWARMPLEVPPIPNVEMFFETMPFELT